MNFKKKLNSTFIEVPVHLKTGEFQRGSSAQFMNKIPLLRPSTETIILSTLLFPLGFFRIINRSSISSAFHPPDIRCICRSTAPAN